MKTRSTQNKLKAIQNHCDEIANSFARISLELSDLLNEESSDTEIEVETPPIVVAERADISRVEQKVKRTTNKAKTPPSVVAERADISRVEEKVKRTTNKADKVFNKVKKTSINLFKRPSNKFNQGDIVKINNHYQGKYGDLYSREGVVHKVGKSFIFVCIEGIPVLQQHAEENLVLISKRVSL